MSQSYVSYDDYVDLACKWGMDYDEEEYDMIRCDLYEKYEDEWTRDQDYQDSVGEEYGFKQQIHSRYGARIKRHKEEYMEDFEESKTQNREVILLPSKVDLKPVDSGIPPVGDIVIDLAKPKDIAFESAGPTDKTTSTSGDELTKISFNRNSLKNIPRTPKSVSAGIFANVRNAIEQIKSDKRKSKEVREKKTNPVQRVPKTVDPDLFTSLHKTTKEACKNVIGGTQCITCSNRLPLREVSKGITTCITCLSAAKFHSDKLLSKGYMSSFESAVAGGQMFKIHSDETTTGVTIHDELSTKIGNGEFVKSNGKVYLQCNKHFRKHLPRSIKSVNNPKLVEIFDFSQPILFPEHIDGMLFPTTLEVSSRMNTKCWDLEVSFKFGEDYSGAYIDVERHDGWYRSVTQAFGLYDDQACIMEYASNTDKADCGKAVVYKGVYLGFHSGTNNDGLFNRFVAMGPRLERFFKTI